MPAVVPEFRQFTVAGLINGEGIQMYHAPNAITDGDSIVYFRFSDVIVTGDLFTPGRYPMIETAKGGSVQGVLNGLNQVIELAFPEFRHASRSCDRRADRNPAGDRSRGRVSPRRCLTRSSFI